MLFRKIEKDIVSHLQSGSDKILMYPLDFEEFLIANEVGPLVLDTIRKKYAERASVPDAIHNKLLDLFKKYLLVGGLPDAVNEYLSTKNITTIRAI